VTSPTGIANGDYPLTVTVQRVGSTDTASTTSWYKVYSSDSVKPTLYWPSPGDGTTITGRSYDVAVSATDDHAVKHIDLYLDNATAPVSTTTCDGVSYSCNLNYSWSTTKGPHTATFKAYDWLGNMSTLTTSFTVS
jgi:Bacterial Ig domain